MLRLGEVLQRGTSQHIHIEHQEDFYNNSLLSSLSLLLTLFLSVFHSLANFSAATPCLPPFCFSVTSVPVYQGRKQIDKRFSIYSKVEVGV